MAVLSAVLHRCLGDVAIASIWDPQTAALCAEVGVGAQITVRLGGKTNISSGTAIDVSARVCAVKPEHDQGSLGGTRQRMGLCVWLQVAGVDVVVSNVRSQVFAPDIFTGLGIELKRKKIVVVKSTNHFFSQFAHIASRIIRMATPGALNMDFAKIDYQKRSLDYFPRVADPLQDAERDR